jgi:DNA-binding LytR/AlgR family response regulator
MIERDYFMKTIRVYERDWIPIKVSDIVCCRADKVYTIITLRTGRRINANGCLAATMRLIDCSPFFRIHKSWCVNLLYLQEMNCIPGQRMLLMEGWVFAEVSEVKCKPLMDRLEEMGCNIIVGKEC